MIRFFCWTIITGFLFLGCRKGMLVEQEQYIRFNLDVFITDTALYQTVQLNDTTLSAKAQVINGSYANLVNGNIGIPRPATDTSLLKVEIIKKNAANIRFSDSISLNTINDYLLLQLSPATPPRLINKITEAKRYSRPGNDSVKLRFYFTSSDKIINPKDNNRVVQVVDLKLYKVVFAPNGNPAVKSDTTIKGIEINKLSAYFTFGNEIYGFDLLDGKDGLTASQKILQKYSFDPFDFFVNGAMEKRTASDGVFQTLRVQRSNSNTGPFVGKYLFSFK